MRSTPIQRSGRKSSIQPRPVDLHFNGEHVFKLEDRYTVAFASRRKPLRREVVFLQIGGKTARKHLLILIGRNVASIGKGICSSIVGGTPSNNGDLPAIAKRGIMHLDGSDRILHLAVNCAVFLRAIGIGNLAFRLAIVCTNASRGRNQGNRQKTGDAESSSQADAIFANALFHDLLQTEYLIELLLLFVEHVCRQPIWVMTSTLASASAARCSATARRSLRAATSAIRSR